MNNIQYSCAFVNFDGLAKEFRCFLGVLFMSTTALFICDCVASIGLICVIGGSIAIDERLEKNCRLQSRTENASNSTTRCHKTIGI